MTKLKTTLIASSLVLLFILITLATWLYSRIDGSLPQLDGKQMLYGLSDKVTIERDLQGIATINAITRNDAAMALGFVHAQERFFQMDLLRRNSAGELSSLFGERALDYDKEIRLHRFRDRARKIVSQLPKEEFALLKAYTRGVNQGLQRLNTPPFEYLLLQQDPLLWQEEDTVLTILSMYIDLQYRDGRLERTKGIMKQAFGDDVYNFLNPEGSQWDAAIDNTTYEPSPMPKRAWPAASSEPSSDIATKQTSNKEQFPGSNNWAVSGQLTATKSALIANDMHLGIRVPNTWYRASIIYQQDESSKTNQAVKVTGLTLPGTPSVVVGSNGSIAWGFTNSYGDWSDVIELTLNDNGDQYLTPNGFEPFIINKQMIAIKDQASIEVTIYDTIWGPVLNYPSSENKTSDKLYAYRWVAHDIEAVNFSHRALETTTSVEQAFIVASKAGIPAQNMMVGDKNGNIGWTIMGPIPRKTSNFGDTPSNWANGENAWTGYLNTDEYPQVLNPQNQRLWTANSRVVGEEMLKKIGNGGYAIGARSSQIRDRLFEKQQFSEQDFLDIALDTEAIFLKRWLLFINEKVLTDEAIVANPDWMDVKNILTTDTLFANADSVAYRIVSNFRLATRDIVFETLNNNLSRYDQAYQFSTVRHQIETPLWQLINEQPANFLWLSRDSWQEIFHEALTHTIHAMKHFNDKEQLLANATWGQENTTRIHHPLSSAIPFFGKYLNMPDEEISGDSYIPRVDGQAFGASERMIVSPGFEESGILHMPTSQSGHPWSPYFGKGHQDWKQGKPSPFLPGKTAYTLTLHSY